MTATATLTHVTDLPGEVNTPVETILAQIRASLYLGHPQLHIQPEHGARALLVAGGPSLEATEGEIVDRVWAGDRLITVNGAYQWCLARHLKPYAQIVLDARPSTVNFVEPVVPGVRYYVASQCHPAVWQTVQDVDTWIWHACCPEDESRRAILDAYYGGRWHGIPGGTTVTIQGLMLLRSLGYVRVDLFGADCCIDGTRHHAYAQPENDADMLLRFDVFPTARPEDGRRFTCSPWHVQQFNELLRVITANRAHMAVTVHGDGLLAYALRANGHITVREVAA
jgi:hypothetical protein